MELDGKKALVTGAGVRVGRAIALELGRAGCDVAVHYRNSRAGAEEVADQVRALGRRATLVQADFNQPEASTDIVDQAAAELGGLHILVNNAAGFDKLPLEATDAAAWRRILQANLIAPALLAEAAAPHMRKAGWGAIINFSDILAERPPRGYTAYCTSKAGIDGLTRCLAIELAPEITVNAIAPGIAGFPEDYDEQTRQRHIERVPLKRAGSPEEMAALVKYLLTAGRYITGQTIRVDGGRSVRQ